MLHGALRPDEVLAAAQDVDARTQRGQRCEADFHVGAFLDLTSHASEATAHYQAAVTGCPKDFVEYGAAKSALAILDPGAGGAPSRAPPPQGR